jgi:septal ring factor EnvC (AmiA/AmiB activator)
MERERGREGGREGGRGGGRETEREREREKERKREKERERGREGERERERGTRAVREPISPRQLLSLDASLLPINGQWRWYFCGTLGLDLGGVKRPFA